MVCASAKLLGGMTQTGTLRVTKLCSLKLFGSTMTLSTLVKTLNSEATRAS